MEDEDAGLPALVPLPCVTREVLVDASLAHCEATSDYPSGFASDNTSVVPRRSLPGVRTGGDPTIKQRTDALVDGLNLVLEHHGAPRSIRQQLKEQLHAYGDDSESEMIWLTRMKYVLTYPLAKYLRNPLPPAPSVPFGPKKELRAWMKVRLTVFSRKNTHLWYSWLQAKRGTLAVSEAVVMTTYDKHFTGLTQPDPADWTVVADVMDDPTLYTVLDELRREASKLHLSTFTERRTSSSACFEQTRSAGGQVAELRRVVGLPAYLLEREFVRMDWYPVVYAHEKLVSQCVTTYTYAGSEEWALLGAHALAHDWSKPVACTIQAVLEPMKVRVISKGEALPYYNARPLQKLLHRKMRNMDCFRLIGRPFCPTDLIDLRERSAEGDEWFSIDYSAATDGLSWRLSSQMLLYILGDQPQEVQDVAYRVLGPHDLYYPERRLGKMLPPQFRGTQTRGQLMGSILSFPLLCLCNLAVYLRATRESQAGWSHEDRLRHVLVNGDDMVYSASPALWDEHIRIGRSVGLEMSVGKAYHHPVYANVNSTSIHYDLRSPTATPWQIDYLNVGLYVGQHKVQGRDEGLAASHHMDDTGSCASNLAVILRGLAPCSRFVDHRPRVVDHIMNNYLTLHASSLLDECKTASKCEEWWTEDDRLVEGRPVKSAQSIVRNLFLPITSGGMGVPPPAGWRVVVSTAQRRYAAHLTIAHSAPMTFGSPTLGHQLDDLDDFVEVPWFKREAESEKPTARCGAFALRRKLCLWGIVRYGARRGVVCA